MENTTPFLIGVATSGYQSEGGYNGPRYRADFALARGMGLNAFRLSIEWSRVQPSFTNTPGRAPAFDGEAVDAYADRVAACRAEGLEPVVTLHHFTHPAWLGVDAWLDDTTPEAFQRFVQYTLEACTDWRTISHPARRHPRPSPFSSPPRNAFPGTSRSIFSGWIITIPLRAMP